MARLAGADVVLPYTDGTAPSPEDLTAASAAARVLAGRAAIQRAETGRAAHEVAGNASAIAMAAELLATDTLRRADQLRSLARQGAELAWRAGRAARSGTGPLEAVEVVAAMRSLCRSGRPGGLLPTVESPDCDTAYVLLDRARFARALNGLLDNARRAGSTVVSMHLRLDRHHADSVEITVIDDGHGLAEGWNGDVALRPFVTGWSIPGDGLGLTEAAEFAADHGGRLTIGNRPYSRGVEVRLRLSGAVPRSAAGPRRNSTVALEDADWSIAHILEGIARRDPPEKSLTALVTALEQRLPGSTCSILLLDQDSRTLHHGAGERLPAPYRAAIDGVRIGPLVGSCGTAAFTRSEIIATDIETDLRWADYRELALRHGLGSCWSTPILDVDRGIVLGTFAVYHAAHWFPDPAATELVQRLTHVAAVAISTAGLHAELVESEARFRSTFETTGLGIALVGLDGRIQQANAALTTMAGRSLGGICLFDLMDVEDARGVESTMSAALVARTDHRTGSGATDRLPPVEVRVRIGGLDEPLWAVLSGSLIRGRGGDPSRFCIELFDLTERRRVAQARRERAVAEAANRAKSDLLALVSHELRTPLNAVIGFAQLLGMFGLTAQQQRDGVGHILSAGRHLLQLINDLIDLTGAETGQLHPAAEPVSLTEVVREAIEIVAGLAGERSVTLAGPGSDRVEWVLADRQRLRQVLLNLIGNAIKFTPTGGRVSIGVGRGSATVSDTGPGIAPAHIEQLFTPFHRASDTGAEGSGLGLALSQRLTSAMGGDLTVASELGVGCTFRVQLPTCAAPPADALPGAEPSPAVAASAARPPGGSILYLEDDRASRQLLSAALAQWPGISVQSAATCAEARSLLAAQGVDLLVIDVELPDGNGWDLLRELADRKAYAQPAAIVVTAGSRVLPPGLGPVEVLGKPLVIDEILAAISRRLTAIA